MSLSSFSPVLFCFPLSLCVDNDYDDDSDFSSNRSRRRHTPRPRSIPSALTPRHRHPRGSLVARVIGFLSTGREAERGPKKRRAFKFFLLKEKCGLRASPRRPSRASAGSSCSARPRRCLPRSVSPDITAEEGIHGREKREVEGEDRLDSRRLGRRRDKKNSKPRLVLFHQTKPKNTLVYELQGPSLRDGKPELFRKPWAMTTVMFVGMSFCLPLAHFQEWKAKKKAGAAKRQQRQAAAVASSSPSPANSSLRSPLLGSVEEAATYDGQGNAVPPSHWICSFRAAAGAELRRAALLSVPTAFDLVATVLMNVGLLSVTASVYQMMRGAEMLFAALFAVLFLGRRLNRWHLGGIGCCVAGIGLVGAASVLSGEGSQARRVSTGDMLVGMALIIGSQAVQAAQLTFEDHFMSDAG